MRNLKLRPFPDNLTAPFPQGIHEPVQAGYSRVVAKLSPQWDDKLDARCGNSGNSRQLLL
ncbi:MAG: hypothetical protein HYY46_13870 [Deltaproteobacteria bacterium]|nr:hypothetical protein [Deltaproteobacteria bacterium]